MNVPTINLENVIKMLPSQKSPTQIPTRDPDVTVVEILVPRDEFLAIQYGLEREYDVDGVVITNPDMVILQSDKVEIN